MDVENDSVALTSHQATARNYVKFYPKWVRNNFKSKEAGMDVGEHRDFIMIICPGQPKSEVHREVQEKDRAEYRTEWAAYKDGKEHRISGTPVELLPGLDAARADALKAVYVYTIEQLAELSEPAKRVVGMDANSLSQKAQGYLQKNSAEVVALKAEIAKRDEVIERQGNTLSELEKRLSALEAPKKRGPKPKAEAAAH